MARKRQAKPGIRFGEKVARWSKLLWWAASLAVLVWWFFSIDLGAPASAGRRADQERIMEGIMAFLAFPAGLVWVWALPMLTSMLEAFGVIVARWPWYSQPLAAWCGAALLGYLQWFWLLPYVFTLRASDS
jgi:hypothetical protein